MFRVWASKHMSQICGVRRMQKICGFWDNSRCPRCKQENKTTRHVIVCTSNGAAQEWTNQITNLGLWLIEMNTHPSVQKCILESLMSHSTATLFTTSADPFCFSAAREQDEIGWQILWKARLHDPGECCKYYITKSYTQSAPWICGQPDWLPSYWN
jgi:hypothetical protein